MDRQKTKKHKGIRDLKGKRSGKLLVIKRTNKRTNGSVVWLCKCDCGNEKLVMSTRLVNGGTSSCGCIPKGPEPNLRKYEEIREMLNKGMSQRAIARHYGLSPVTIQNTVMRMKLRGMIK